MNISVQQKLKKIVEILGNTVQNTLDVSLALLAKIEFEHRPDHYTNSNYRNGINTLDFLYDILNYLSGYHDLDCYFTQNPHKFINCVLAFTNFDQIMKISDPRV